LWRRIVTTIYTGYNKKEVQEDEFVEIMESWGISLIFKNSSQQINVASYKTPIVVIAALTQTSIS